MSVSIRTDGAEPCRLALVDSDPWVPLTVVWADAVPAPRLRLYVRDPQQGYVELKVDPGSGGLRGIVVIDTPRLVDREQPGGAAVVRDMVPRLDLQMWPWKLTPDYREPLLEDVDVQCSLALSITDERFTVWFADDAVEKSLLAGSARVGISEGGGLVFIDVPLGGIASPWRNGDGVAPL